MGMPMIDVPAREEAEAPERPSGAGSPPGRDELFGTLNRRGTGRRGGLPLWLSLAIHGGVAAAVLLGPLLWPSPLPGVGVDPATVFFYDPPPPPPLPLPRGSPLVPERSERRRRPAPEPEKPPRESQAPSDSVRPRLELPPDFIPADLSEELWGSETGSPLGVPEGMEGGIPEGQIGGVPGGVVGGVIGGRLGGVLPVRDPDRPPRLIRQTKPIYPQEAFVKKIEGTVVLEILIDADGRVPHARVLQSIPALDDAALATVRQWVFQPAVKDGRPVPTLARAPIHFVIY